LSGHGAGGDLCSTNMVDWEAIFTNAPVLVRPVPGVPRQTAGRFYGRWSSRGWGDEFILEIGLKVWETLLARWMIDEDDIVKKGRHANARPIEEFRQIILPGQTLRIRPHVRGVARGAGAGRGFDHA